MAALDDGRIVRRLALTWAITVCVIIVLIAMSSCVHGDPVDASLLPCQCLTDEVCEMRIYASVDAYSNVAQDSIRWSCR